MQFLGEIPVMKTTTVEINSELAQMLWNLVDAGAKHPELGGNRLMVQGAMCVQWLQSVQQKFAVAGNGAMPVVPEVDEVAENGNG